MRQAREQDLDRLVAIHAAAFPDARNRDTRRRNFTDNSRGGLSDLLVAERHGVVAGHAFAFRMTTWLEGRQIPIGGVASVGVAPEARGRGVARALLRAIDEELRARGAPLALLYPFRHRFYRRLGYGLVSEVRRVRVSPAALPRGPAGVEVLMARGPDHHSAVRRCYQRVASRTNGMVGRTDAVWRTLLTAEGRHVALVVDSDDEVRGYLVYHYLNAQDGLAQEIDVVELVAGDDDARRALYGFLHAQRDQVPCVRIVLDARDPLIAVLDEPRGPYPQTIRSLIPVVGEVGAGAMLALVDKKAALRTRGWLADGRLGLRIRGDGAGDDVVMTLDVSAGVPQVDDGVKGAALRTDRSTFAQIYAGALTPTAAVRLGFAEADAATCATADRLFQTTSSFFPLDVF